MHSKLNYMKINLGSADRIIRIVLAAIFALLYFTGTITGTFGIILIALAVVLVLTSLVSFCPLYFMLGLSSCPAKK